MYKVKSTTGQPVNIAGVGIIPADFVEMELTNEQMMIIIATGIIEIKLIKQSKNGKNSL